MYSIYSDDICIYSDTSIDDTVKIANPVLTLTDNEAGSLTLTVPPTNAGYSRIQRMVSKIRVLRDSEEIWSGRVINEDTDFWNNRKLTCEGELSFLVDTIQPLAEYDSVTVREFLEAILAVHNSKVEADKQFTVGAVTVNDENNTFYEITNYESTLECINSKLIDYYGGHLRIRKEDGIRYLDYLEEYPNTNTQTIEFGENLLDFTRNFDMTQLSTVVVPRGARLETSPVEDVEAYLTVESVNKGSIYVKSDEAISKFGWIESIVDFENVTDAPTLLKMGQLYLESIQFENMVLELSAVDFHYISKSIEPIKLLDEIRCVSYFHGLDKFFPVTNIEIPLDTPEDTVFTLGTDQRQSLTEYTKTENLEIKNKIENIPSKSNILKDAKENATQLINSATNGFITIVKDDHGAQALIISETEDYTASRKLWRWNINGLGYSKDGGASYETAITMDGSIVANFITTGTMSADRIRTGILTDQGNNTTFNLNDGTLTMKKGSINIGNGVFSVTTGGRITATSGTIGGFTITNDKIYNSTIALRNDGIWYYYNDTKLGDIGTNGWADIAGVRGLIFDLDAQGSYMAWAAKSSSGDQYYWVKFLYANQSFDIYQADKLYLGCPLDFNGYMTTNMWLDPETCGINNGITARVEFARVNSLAKNGTALAWNENNYLEFKNGFLVDCRL